MGIHRRHPAAEGACPEAIQRASQRGSSHIFRYHYLNFFLTALMRLRLVPPHLYRFGDTRLWAIEGSGWRGRPDPHRAMEARVQPGRAALKRWQPATSAGGDRGWPALRLRSAQPSSTRMSLQYHPDRYNASGQVTGTPNLRSRLLGYCMASGRAGRLVHRFVRSPRTNVAFSRVFPATWLSCCASPTLVAAEEFHLQSQRPHEAPGDGHRPGASLHSFCATVATPRNSIWNVRLHTHNGQPYRHRVLEQRRYDSPA